MDLETTGSGFSFVGWDFPRKSHLRSIPSPQNSNLVTGEMLSEKTLSIHCDLSYDLWRRILQFGSIHEIDEEKLQKSTLFNPNFSKITKNRKTGVLSQFWSSGASDADTVQVPEISLLIKEELQLSNG